MYIQVTKLATRYYVTTRVSSSWNGTGTMEWEQRCTEQWFYWQNKTPLDKKIVVVLSVINLDCTYFKHYHIFRHWAPVTLCKLPLSLGWSSKYSFNLKLSVWWYQTYMSMLAIVAHSCYSLYLWHKEELQHTLNVWNIPWLIYLCDAFNEIRIVDNLKIRIVDNLQYHCLFQFPFHGVCQDVDVICRARKLT